MVTASNEYLNELNDLCERRKNEIRNTPDTLLITGTKYYVSNNGNDNNDGLTPETAWCSLKKVSETDLKAGDGVLLRRGDLFRGRIRTRPGVAYAAFGCGDKPKIYGWDKSLADPQLWELYDGEKHIWKYTEKILDTGTLVFNDGEFHSIKLIPSYIHGEFVCRNDESKRFDMRNEMTRDLDIYWHFEDLFSTDPSKGEDFPIPEMCDKSYGDLYLRCDRGNPGDVFSSIEALPRRHGITVWEDDNVRIDNLCLMYIGLHGVGAAGACVKGLHVTNCEFGWIGGTIQSYSGTDPNYPQGRRGSVTRYGNAVEVYGGCDDYVVSNCYIYQVYDAGITHQVSTNGYQVEMKNISYHDNLVEDCVYGIEYFLDMNQGDVRSYMEHVEICDNILRDSGFGWGQQRHNVDSPALIKGWSYKNQARDFSIHDNIFYRSGYRMLHLVAEKQQSCPVMYRNTYVQDACGMIGQYGSNAVAEPEILFFDENADVSVSTVFGDTDAELYVID